MIKTLIKKINPRTFEITSLVARLSRCGQVAHLRIIKAQPGVEYKSDRSPGVEVLKVAISLSFSFDSSAQVPDDAHLLLIKEEFAQMSAKIDSDIAEAAIDDILATH